ncbi:hypothetical protein MATL_G00021990 [Megalops atlanticus]|uniref:Uncharacterized protein n=1 Tax=Megalops atlanticus TaxID=7932 RepID=A0A9D3QGZ2_MEGAT|nr:hypothetical protein MATL_G00021990 [Megalops atlanticus]
MYHTEASTEEAFSGVAEKKTGLGRCKRALRTHPVGLLDPGYGRGCSGVTVCSVRSEIRLQEPAAVPPRRCPECRRPQGGGRVTPS